MLERQTTNWITRPPALLFAAIAALTPAVAAAEDGLDADIAALTAAKAAGEDHRAGDDAKARARLEGALAACGADRCSPAVAARLHRDLGLLLSAEAKSSCEADEDCHSGQTCTKEGVCAPAPVSAPPQPPPPSPAPPPEASSGFWIGAGVQADIAFLNGGAPCSRESQSAATYACFRADGEQYLGVPTPSARAPVSAAYGTTRLALQIERALPHNLSVGGRFGFAFGGGPTPAKGPTFVPLHLEARLAYWFGQPLSRATGLRGFASLMGGLAQMDASRAIAVDECLPGSASGCTPATNVQPGGVNPDHQTLDAYKKAGQAFVGLGVGAFYSFLPGSGLMVELRALQFFPSSATTFSPSIAYVFQVL